MFGAYAAFAMLDLSDRPSVRPTDHYRAPTQTRFQWACQLHSALRNHRRRQDEKCRFNLPLWYSVVFGKAIMKKPDVAVILVHGVGSTERGIFLSNFAELAGLPTRETFSGVVADTATADLDGRTIQFVECYWGDLRAALHGVVGTTLFLVRMLVAMLSLGANGWRHSDHPAARSLLLGPVIFWLVLFGSVAVQTPIFLTLHLSVLEGWVVVPGVLIACASAALLMVPMAGRVRGFVWLLTVTVCLAIGAIVLHYLMDSPANLEHLGALSGRIVGTVQAIAAALVLLASAEILARALLHRKSVAAKPYLVRVFFLSFPIAIVTAGFGAVVAATNLWYVTEVGDPVRLKAWSDGYTAALQYDLASMELVMAVSTAVFGLTIIAVLAAYFMRTRSSNADVSSGAGSSMRKGLAATLVLYAALVAGVIALFAVTSAFDILLLGTGIPILTIYALSALRLGPYAPAVLRCLRMPLQIAGDVILWIVKNPEMSIAPGAKERIQSLSSHFAKEGARIVVLAYSQGSVIAANGTGGRSTPDCLITMGSPITTLYQDFLDIRLTPAVAGGWQNLYRPSDFVGGAIESPQANNVLLEDNPRLGHFNYQLDAKVKAALQNAIRN